MGDLGQHMTSHVNNNLLVGNTEGLQLLIHISTTNVFTWSPKASILSWTTIEVVVLVAVVVAGRPVLVIWHTQLEHVSL